MFRIEYSNIKYLNIERCIFDRYFNISYLTWLLQSKNPGSVPAISRLTKNVSEQRRQWRFNQRYCRYSQHRYFPPTRHVSGDRNRQYNHQYLEELLVWKTLTEVWLEKIHHPQWMFIAHHNNVRWGGANTMLMFIIIWS